MEQRLPLNLLPDPLDQYPVLDLASLEALNTDNDTFRRKSGYGLKFYNQIGRKAELLYCAYCGFRFDDFSHWLRASLDHVVPRSAASELKVDKNIWDSVLNLVFVAGHATTLTRALMRHLKLWKFFLIDQI